METPRTNPVGLPIVPGCFSQSPRSYPSHTRVVASLILGALLSTVLVTTASSLGAYCLTTDTANTRSLPTDHARERP
jgi:hypothetical protein